MQTEAPITDHYLLRAEIAHTSRDLCAQRSHSHVMLLLLNVVLLLFLLLLLCYFLSVQDVQRR